MGAKDVNSREQFEQRHLKIFYYFVLECRNNKSLY